MTQTAGKAEPRQIGVWEVAESKQAKKHMAWGSIAYGTLAQKRSERKSANERGMDIFYNRSKAEVSKNRPKRSERKSANEKGTDIFYNWSEAEVSKNRPKKR